MSDHGVLDNVSRETLEKLRRYESLLHKWQKAINLVAPSTLKDSWDRHFVDSLQLLKHVSRETSTLLDIGSGAGFPGLVLAIARPEIKVTLVESDLRKCEFIRNVSRETFSGATILNERIENLTHSRYDVITSRALASLDQLMNYVEPFSDSHTKLFFLKGENHMAEVIEARNNWSFDLEIYPSVTDSRGVILKINHLRGKTS